MDIEQDLYTVEFVEPYTGVVHFREIGAADIVDAKQQILTMHPDAIIRAVSMVKQETLTADLDQLAVEG
jgi:hypothetical protein